MKLGSKKVKIAKKPNNTSNKKNTHKKNHLHRISSSSSDEYDYDYNLLEGREDSEEEFKSCKLSIPAIVCDGCADALKKLLIPFLYEENEKFCYFNVNEKTASLTIHKDRSVENILHAIIEGGYGDPDPTEIEILDSKRNRPFALQIQDFGNVLIEFPEKINKPVLHQFKIETARTENCLADLSEKFKKININCNYNMEEKTIELEADESVDANHIKNVIKAAGHNPTSAEMDVIQPQIVIVEKTETEEKTETKKLKIGL